MATFSLSEYLLTKEKINDIYSILTVSHPNLEQYKRYFNCKSYIK